MCSRSQFHGSLRRRHPNDEFLLAEFDGEDWVELPTTGDTPPRGLTAPALSFHEATDSLVLFGGITNNVAAGLTATTQGDT